MGAVDSVRAYWRYARTLSRCWDRSFAITAARLAISRVVYQRGPEEFDAFRFANKPLSAWKTYIPERELLALQQPVAPVERRRFDENKLVFENHCKQSGLPTVPIVAFIAPKTGEAAAFAENRLVRSARELANVLASAGDFDGFAKTVGGGQGYGAFGFASRAGVVTTVTGPRTVAELFEFCSAGPFAHSGYVLQPRIHPHPALQPLMPGPGLGTVRVLTFLTRNSGVAIPWAFLKVPAPAAECDNLRLGSLVCDVDVQTGALGAGVGATKQRPVVHSMECHPTTGVRFADISLPHWPAVIDLVTRAARAFDMLPALGWDVAIGSEGPVLLETNWQFSLPERVLDRGLAREARQLYAQVADELI